MSQSQQIERVANRVRDILQKDFSYPVEVVYHEPDATAPGKPGHFSIVEVRIYRLLGFISGEVPNTLAIIVDEPIESDRLPNQWTRTSEIRDVVMRELHNEATTSQSVD